MCVSVRQTAVVRSLEGFTRTTEPYDVMVNVELNSRELKFQSGDRYDDGCFFFQLPRRQCRTVTIKAPKKTLTIRQVMPTRNDEKTKAKSNNKYVVKRRQRKRNIGALRMRLRGVTVL